MNFRASESETFKMWILKLSNVTSSATKNLQYFSVHLTWSWQNATQNPLQHFLPSWNSIVLASFSFAWKVCIHSNISMYPMYQNFCLQGIFFGLLLMQYYLEDMANDVITIFPPSQLHIVNEKGHPIIFDGDWAIRSWEWEIITLQS